jgi:steroid 5-alpha reductase family enzyme
MPLSRDEQRLLAGIETGLRADDPAFAAKLTSDTADRYRRHEMVLTHACMWLGMFMTLTGFALLHQVPAAGALLMFYGTGILISALIAMLLRPVHDALQRLRRSDR